MNGGIRMETQNIYDDETFFQGYRTLRQNDTGLNGALITPALCRLLPDLESLDILDLGCGFGDFARFARKDGAASVTGVDASVRMLQEAAARTNDAAVQYLHATIERYTPPEGAFDLVVSCLALHYIEDYPTVVRRCYRALKPGGRFVLVVEHPICTSNPAGWVHDRNGRPSHWPVDRYLSEGKRITKWFIDGVIKYHRTVETYVNTLVDSGFLLVHLGEPGPTGAALATRPQLQTDTRRPPFLFLSALHPR